MDESGQPGDAAAADGTGDAGARGDRARPNGWSAPDGAWPGAGPAAGSEPAPAAWRADPRPGFGWSDGRSRFADLLSPAGSPAVGAVNGRDPLTGRGTTNGRDLRLAGEARNGHPVNGQYGGSGQYPATGASSRPAGDPDEPAGRGSYPGRAPAPAPRDPTGSEANADELPGPDQTADDRPTAGRAADDRRARDGAAAGRAAGDWTAGDRDAADRADDGGAAGQDPAASDRAAGTERGPARWPTPEYGAGRSAGALPTADPEPGRDALRYDDARLPEALRYGPTPASAPPYPYEGDLDDSGRDRDTDRERTVPLERPALPDAPAPYGLPAPYERSAYRPIPYDRPVPYDKPAPFDRTGAFDRPGAFGASGAFDVPGAFDAPGARDAPGAVDRSGAADTSRSFEASGSFDRAVSDRAVSDRAVSDRAVIPAERQPLPVERELTTPLAESARHAVREPTPPEGLPAAPGPWRESPYLPSGEPPSRASGRAEGPRAPYEPTSYQSSSYEPTSYGATSGRSPYEPVPFGAGPGSAGSYSGFAARPAAQPEPIRDPEPVDDPDDADPAGEPAAELPQRVPAQPDVPTVPEPPSVDPPAETPELARIASHLRRDDPPPRQRPDGFDVKAILAAVREVGGVRDASLRTTPAGAHSLRLDLAEGADPAEVSRLVARLLQDRMGLSAAPQNLPGVDPRAAYPPAAPYLPSQPPAGRRPPAGPRPDAPATAGTVGEASAGSAAVGPAPGSPGAGAAAGGFAATGSGAGRPAAGPTAGSGYGDTGPSAGSFPGSFPGLFPAGSAPATTPPQPTAEPAGAAQPPPSTGSPTWSPAAGRAGSTAAPAWSRAPAEPGPSWAGQRPTVAPGSPAGGSSYLSGSTAYQTGSSPGGAAVTGPAGERAASGTAPLDASPGTDAADPRTGRAEPDLDGPDPDPGRSPAAPGGARGRASVEPRYVERERTGQRYAGSAPAEAGQSLAAATDRTPAGQGPDAERVPPRPLVPGHPPGPRVIIDQVQVNLFGIDATVQVRLAVGDRSATGSAGGPAVESYVLRLCAGATVAAVDDLLAGGDHPEGPVRCFVEHAAVVPLGSCEVAVVVLLLTCGTWVEQLAGSAVVAGDPRQAAVRATLAAVNRRLEALLS